MVGRGILFLVAVVPTIASAQPVPKQPTGKWVVEYADKMCVVQRDYGTRIAPLMLALRPSPMGGSVTAYVLDAPTRQSPSLVPVKVGFGPGAPPIDANLATFDIRGHDLRFNEISVEREKLEPAFKTEILSFEARRRINVSFAVPRMAAAFKVLDECVVNLLDSWGFSRERQAAMAQGPEPLKPMTAYITPKDYPTEALSGEEAGSNSARYWVDAKGRVSGCTIVESSKSKALDNTLCKVINRIRFRPALDKTGKPMESIGFQRVRWILG